LPVAVVVVDLVIILMVDVLDPVVAEVDLEKFQV
tara:strand:+ start:93 stop:194 length:102 start_codon:yes stop_codon:yes gene_type:complete